MIITAITITTMFTGIAITVGVVIGLCVSVVTRGGVDVVVVNIVVIVVGVVGVRGDVVVIGNVDGVVGIFTV
jgi:hypothetical protein